MAPQSVSISAADDMDVLFGPPPELVGILKPTLLGAAFWLVLLHKL